jgi:hypothetical protein
MRFSLRENFVGPWPRDSGFTASFGYRQTGRAYFSFVNTEKIAFL